jgi:hypothetical protein
MPDWGKYSKIHESAINPIDPTKRTKIKRKSGMVPLIQYDYGGTSYYDIEISNFKLSKIPMWIGCVPVGLCEWYKGTNYFVHYKGQFDGLCPLKGSKVGIARQHGTRVYEYDYYFAEWLGSRLAKRFKKTGKRIWVLNTKKTISPDSVVSSVEKCFNDAFLVGFSREIGTGSVVDSGNKQAFMVNGFNYKNKKYSSIYLFAANDLPEEKVDIVLGMIRDCANMELIEGELFK